MSDDIVTRLRSFVGVHPFPEKGKSISASDLVEAADEIERLRAERDEAINEVSLLRSTVTDRNIEIERLRSERDEARREILLWVKERCSWSELSDEIKKRGWDYLKEDSK